MGIRWNSALHPRDARGRFKKKRGGGSTYESRIPKTQGRGVRLSASESSALKKQVRYGAMTGIILGGGGGGVPGLIGGAAGGAAVGALEGTALIVSGRRRARAASGSKVKR